MNLASAIQNWQVITFTYDGLPRVVQPATYGATTTGKLTLRGCLIGGESRRNTIPCWELFTEAKIANLALAGSTFVTFECEGYTQGDSAFAAIVAEH
jgi:hypothetical protein